ncbi:MAG TPA: RecX family transcriptional regulator [Bacteroidota bacterium]|nr:RecX family transcriptional regulator [Bacteroidota bacterium]
MKITSIEPQKKRPGRLNIYADGEFLIGVASETLIRFALRRGDDITPSTVAALAREEELLGARAAALRLLGVRPRSVREIRDALREKEFADDIAAETIASLGASGLLDDAAFARAYCRNVLALRPSGGMLLKKKLLLLGVDRETAEGAIADVLGGVDQVAVAARAAGKFLSRKRRSAGSDPRLRQQVAAFLMRRGYAWDVVEEALRRAMKGENAGREPL